MFGASSELAGVMEFGFNETRARRFCGRKICRFSQQGAIATEMLSSTTLMSRGGAGRQAGRRVYYVTLMAGYYSENFHVDMPQTFHTTDRRIALTRPRLYAELDYCNTQGVISAYM